MTETAHHLLLVQITGSPLEPANSLHLGVHSQRVLPRDARLLLGSLIQAMQLVWLAGWGGGVRQHIQWCKRRIYFIS